MLAVLLPSGGRKEYTDEEGRVLFLSEPYTRMFGIRLEDAIGRSPFDLYPHAFAQTFYDNIRAVAETNGTLETIEDAPRPDGTLGHFLVRLDVVQGYLYFA